jgi:hypothetical protein
MYLLSCTDVYRVDTVAEVEALHEELSEDANFTLVSFSYKTKYIKEKREIVGEYQVVTAKKVFNDEKEPERRVEIHYEV